MKYVRYLLLIIFIGGYIYYTERSPLQTETLKTHTVKEGENLYSISKQYSADLRNLIRSNELKPPYNISAGDILKIPSSPYYIVKEGDTLHAIAHKHGASLYAIVQLNKLQEPYIIRPKQKIYIPNAEPQIKEPESVQFPTKFSDKGGQFLIPTSGKVISSFGEQGLGIYNDGINFSAKKGSAIRSANDGQVVYSDNGLQRLGNLVLIRHAGGYITAYAHNDKNLVQRGDKVKRGQVIATIGSSGNVRTPQLHFQIRKGKEILDPDRYISE